MNASTATADAPLRQAVMRRCGMTAGGLTRRDLDVLFKYASASLGSTRPSRLASWRFRHDRYE